MKIVLLAMLALAGQISAPRKTTDPREALINALHPPPKLKEPPSAMTLPSGYRHASSVDFEGNLSGEISKAGGLLITYSVEYFLYTTEYPVDKSQYREYIEETINERLLWRGFRSGRHEVNAEQRRKPDFAFVVHFSAAVKQSSDAADMLTIARSMYTECRVGFPNRFPGYDQEVSLDESQAKYVGKMTGPNLSIEYKVPLFPYQRRIPIDKAQYREFAEEMINGHHLWRGFQNGQYEVNIDVCRVPEASHVVRFKTQVKESSQAADMVAIARSLVGSDRLRANGCVSMD